MNRSRVSMWIVIAVLWSLGPLTSTGVAQEDEKPQFKGRTIAQTMHWKGAEWLLRETREKEERVSVLMEALGVEAGQTVCDLGCGNGYHALRLARRVDLSPLHPPPARQMHGMAYDEEDEVIILFGGRRTGGGDTFNDTWEYNHRTNSWRSLGPQPSPPVQDHINLAYDAKHKKTVLFCGPVARDQSTIGTWVYDHPTNHWSTLTTEHTPTGDHTSLIYNRNAGTMMLFGNSEVTRGLEIWILDLETPAWAIARSFSEPSYREHFGFAYDEDHDVYLLIGGFPNDDNWLLKVQ